jgi:predicted RNA-binding Zn ribbon-like protein
MPDVFYPETAQSAPGELEVVRRFVNTLDLEKDELDKFERPEDLAAWLKDAGLTSKRVAAKPADLKRAREVREALRRLMLANNGYELSDDDAVEVVNRAAARAKVGIEFARDGARVAPAAGGVDEGIGNLLAIVARAMADGSWARLKACGEHSCQWAFYDKSKNRSGRWCVMAECGNRAKARAFRERQRAASKRA